VWANGEGSQGARGQLARVGAEVGEREAHVGVGERGAQLGRVQQRAAQVVRRVVGQVGGAGAPLAGHLRGLLRAVLRTP